MVENYPCCLQSGWKDSADEIIWERSRLLSEHISLNFHPGHQGQYRLRFCIVSKILLCH